MLFFFQSKLNFLYFFPPSSFSLVREYSLANQNGRNVVVSHFVGAAPGSTNIRHTLDRLCGELKRIIDDSQQPDDEKEGNC